MWQILPLALIQSCFLTGGQVFLKLAMQAMGKLEWSWAFVGHQLTNWWWLACGGSFTVATVLWLYILKHFPFSLAYPMSALSYLTAMAAALLVFHEAIPLTRWLGVLCILIGCILVAR